MKSKKEMTDAELIESIKSDVRFVGGLWHSDPNNPPSRSRLEEIDDELVSIIVARERYRSGV